MNFAARRARRSWPIILLLLGMIALQLIVAFFSLYVLSGVRAYVAGESLYSKGQKDAQIYLLDYVANQRESDYQKLLQALAIPLADRRAREALQLPQPDIAAAHAAFIAGGNHPDDVPALIHLFRWFGTTPLMAQSVAAWTEGDRVIEQMRVLVESSHARVLAGDAAALQRIRDEAPALNQRLTELESTFSAQLGEASRRTQWLLAALNGLLALVLAVLGVAFVRRTQRMQAIYEAESKAREALEATSRAKTQFLSRMSHELRTPLNAVIGFAQLLRLDAARAPSGQQLERIQHIERAGAHLLALVNDVLDLSRIESGELSVVTDAVELAVVADEAATLVSPLVTRNSVELFVGNAPTDTVWVRADALRLRQVLVNLLSNAVKYNRPGGSVTLCWQVQAKQCRIEVRDNGPGMSAAQVERLFEPFNRLGAEAGTIEGTGIGLYLSRRLVDSMGGRLDIASRLGEGTCASVTLELMDPGQRPAAAASAPPPRPRAELPLDVLYAEDNEVNAEIVRQLVAQRPAVRLRVATSGAEALEMASESPPELMLVDMNLGDMSGQELARALRSRGLTRSMDLVALSADAMPEHIAAALAGGFRNYLTKPIDFDALLQLLDSYLERH